MADKLSHLLVEFPSITRFPLNSKDRGKPNGNILLGHFLCIQQQAFPARNDNRPRSRMSIQSGIDHHATNKGNVIACEFRVLTRFHVAAMMTASIEV